MAIDDLPLPVVNFLNVIGVPWPYLDEDVVLQFASLTREFGQAVRTTHEDATHAVHALAEAHQGGSIEAMRSGWGAMSDKHVNEIVTGCDALAGALDAAAGYIVAQKAEPNGLSLAMCRVEHRERAIDAIACRLSRRPHARLRGRRGH